MTDILSNNIVRGALAVLVVGAVAYGFQSVTATTTVATTAASCCPATTENVSTPVGNGVVTPVVGATNEGTIADGIMTTEETNETTVQ
jgi:hypothetical protein